MIWFLNMICYTLTVLDVSSSCISDSRISFRSRVSNATFIFKQKKIARLSLNFWQHCGSILHRSRYGFLGALLDYFLKHATNSHFCKGHHFTSKYLAVIFFPFLWFCWALQKKCLLLIRSSSHFLIKTVPVDNQLGFFFSWYLLLWSRLFSLKSISVIFKKYIYVFSVAKEMVRCIVSFVTIIGF